MLWIESDNKRQIAPGSSRVSARLLPTQMSRVNIKELERWLCSKTSYTKKRHLGRGEGWDFKDGGTQSHENGTHLDFNQEKPFRLSELMICDYFENFGLVARFMPPWDPDMGIILVMNFNMHKLLFCPMPLLILCTNNILLSFSQLWSIYVAV